MIEWVVTGQIQTFLGESECGEVRDQTRLSRLESANLNYYITQALQIYMKPHLKEFAVLSFHT